MPREVFAEELEAFLERLDAVAAARIVANDAGEIERIYATSESARDDSSVRRAITSALMSQYNLHLDGWRVHIAHIAPQVRAEPIPECHLSRLEETLTETMTRIVVELRYEREGTQKTSTGSAQAPPGQAHRPRTVALATLDALRPVVERAGSRPSLEGLQFVPFAGTSVALAAVTLASEHMSTLRVGCETVSGSEAEAVVGAVLDAVRKPLRAFAPSRHDRRRQYEGLRRHYEGLITASGRAVPDEATAAVDESVAASPDVSDEAPGSAAEEDDAEPGPAATEGGAPAYGAAEVTHPPAVEGGDVVRSLSEIRPEREGGASIVMREEIRGDTPAPQKAGPRLSLEDAFYRRLATSSVPVHIRCRDGYEIPTAVIKDFGTYSLMVEVNGVAELVFKHGIISIRPYGPVPPETLTPTA